MTHRTLLIAVLSLIVTVSYGVLFYGFSVLITEEAAGGLFSTALLSTAYGGAVLTSGVAAIPVGRVADRVGVRWIVALGSMVGAVGLLGFAAADRSWQVLASWWIALGPAMAMTLYEPAYVAIQQWFEPAARPRGIALLTLAAGLSGPIFVPATAALVEEVGWRAATQLLAFLLVVVGAVGALLVIPRGAGPGGSSDGGASVPLRTSARAFAAPRLFVFTAGALLAYGALEANIVHRVARFHEAGFALAHVGFWAAVSGVLTLPGRFFLPLLGKRLPATAVLAGVLFIIALATGFMVPEGELWYMAAYFLLFGLVFGGALPLRAVVMSGWYGVAGFGTIMGLQTAAIAVARAGFPPLTGAVRDAAGGYGLSMAILTCAFACASCLVYVSGRLRG